VAELRKLKLQMQLTLDGFVGGPNGEMDWVTRDWGADLNQYVERITAPADCILLGRKLAEGFIPYWQSVANNPDSPEQAAGKQFTDLPKIVFSHTPDQYAWPNATLPEGDLASIVNQLKESQGGDLITYGGGGFAASLIAAGLIDEYHLFVNPVAIGEGISIFKNLQSQLSLQFVEANAFECGITVMVYRPLSANR
jgi:dihydrofolate reductase